MPEQQALPVPLRTVATWCRCSTRTANQLASEGVFVRSGHGKYDLQASVGNYLERLRASAAGRGSDEGASLDLTAERARLAKEQADGTALKNAIARGEYVKAADVERQWSEDYRSVQAQ